MNIATVPHHERRGFFIFCGRCSKSWELEKDVAQTRPNDFPLVWVHSASLFSSGMILPQRHPLGPAARVKTHEELSSMMRSTRQTHDPHASHDRSARRSGALTSLFLTLALAACGPMTATLGPVGVGSDEITVGGAQANIASLTEVIKANPRDAGAYNVRGAAFAKSGMNNEALADFTAALTINPNLFQAYNNRAQVYRRLGKLELALADFGRALDMNPSYDQAYVGRAGLFRQTGNIDGALADYQAAIAINSRNPAPFYNRGLILQLRGDHNAAIADFSAAIERDASAPEPFNGRGLSKLAQQNAKGALDDFNNALTLDRTYADAWLNRGVTQEQLGDIEGARAACQRALLLAPQNQITRQCVQRTGGVLSSN
jgi:tetratricopeptide (TPR) repeat protein